MRGRRTFLIVQTVLCVLVAGLLAAAALTLYFDGTAKQAQGDLFAYIYTREKVAAKLLPILPLFFASLGMTIGGRILGVADESQPRADEEKQLKAPVNLRDKAVHQTTGSKELYLRSALLSLAAVLIIAGILNGGLADVLAKGAAICMECIGLG